MDGWSEWSFKASGNPNEVSMTVYLPANPNTWYNGTAYSPGGNSTINIPGESGCANGEHQGTCTVRQATGQNTDCNHWTPEYNYCTNFNDRLTSCDGKCECGLGSVETGWCIASGYNCAGNPTVRRCPNKKDYLPIGLMLKQRQLRHFCAFIAVLHLRRDVFVENNNTFKRLKAP